MKRKINGIEFMNMMRNGARMLEIQVESINGLNVFPVPDGDTGTNMNLTMKSGIREMEAKGGGNLGTTAEALSKGLLLGARGNSGVILSQLFRGFARGVSGLEEADAVQFAAALQQGVVTAYKAVVKPVEGTILTVAKDAAAYAQKAAGATLDVLALMNGVLAEAEAALQRTPSQLPILKQVGVVDAGGQGLVYIYSGFVQALKGERVAAPEIKLVTVGAAEASALSAHAHQAPSMRASSAQAMLATEDIEFGYCTEFIVQLHEQGKQAFDEGEFREQLGEHGDSLLVVSDDDLVKVHIHAEYPGTVMNHAMAFGQLTRIKIENMREQHTHLLETDGGHGSEHAADKLYAASAEPAEIKRYGIIAVGMGDGLAHVFASLGVDHVIAGGQTMNPSTEDIVKAVDSVAAETVFVLPNNGNIVLAAQQAKELSAKQVVVIPSKTVPQGLAAVVAFNETADATGNERQMTSALGGVKSGSVTYAVRDSRIGGLAIRAGDYIGMLDNDIAACGADLEAVCRQLAERMIERGDELVTLYAGAEADEAATARLGEHIAARYPDAEVELIDGGQPLYYYLISAE